MDSNGGTVYMIQGDDDSEWVSPEPVEDVIRDHLVAATDLDDGAIGTLAEYVDPEDLAAVVNGTGEEVTFTVEGHDLTVTSDGQITVQ